jgi:hypothetical protein
MPGIDGSAEHASSAFVGREHERARLRERLAAARDGTGGLALVSGEAGIGKTRLVEQVAADARRSGCVVLWSRCPTGEGVPAYLPWIRLLRSWPEPVSEAGRDLAALLAAAIAEDGEAPLHPALATRRFRLFDAVASTLARAAGSQPLLLVFDDLPSADVGSLKMLEFVIHSVDRVPLLAVGALREPPPPGDHVARLSANSSTLRLRLAGLPEADVERLAAIVLARQPEPGLAARVFARTGGNPFFILESLRLLDVGDAGIDAIPPAVGEVLRQRIVQLRALTRGTLTVAAVIGSDFDLPLLATLLARSRAEVAGALDEAAAARFVVGLPNEPGRWRFAHDLAREVLYADLGADERASLHARVGEALLHRHALDEDRRLSALAHHFAAAAPRGDVERAVEYLVRDAGRAARRLAYEQAAQGSTRALRLLELDAGDPARRCALELALGDAENRAGDFAAARATFLRAADLARRLGVADLLARAALGLGAGSGEVGTTDRALIALLEEARHGVDDGLRAWVQARLARALDGTRQRAEQTALSAEAVAIARRLGDPATLAFTLSERHQTFVGPDDLPDRLAAADEIVALAEATGGRELAVWGHTFRMLDRLESGDSAGALAASAAREGLAAELREPRHRYYSLVFAATWATLTGEHDRAEQQAREALVLGQRIGDPSAGVTFTLQLAVLRAQQGRPPELALDHIGSPPALPAHPADAVARAYWHVVSGRVAAARAEVELLAAGDFTALPRDWAWLAAHATLADVCARLDDARHAEQLYAALRPYAGRVVILGFGTAVLGTVSHALALLAATTKRWDESLAHVHAARELHERLGARPLLVYSAQLEGFVRLARCAPEDASVGRARLEEALAGARALGLAPVVRRIEAHFAARTPAARSEPATDRVIRREGDYWSLTFEGDVCRLRHAKGIEHLATLLRNPNRDFHALDLLAATDERDRSDGDLGPIVDAQARVEYRRRLAELREEQAEAERCHDLGRSARASNEIEAIRHALAGAMGLGGRARRTGSGAERARLIVTKRIKAAVARIRGAHARLGHHLATSVRTGVVCVYTQPPGERAVWRE